MLVPTTIRGVFTHTVVVEVSKGDDDDALAVVVPVKVAVVGVVVQSTLSEVTYSSPSLPLSLLPSCKFALDCKATTTDALGGDADADANDDNDCRCCCRRGSDAAPNGWSFHTTNAPVLVFTAYKHTTLEAAWS